jgi:SAM-dependent methyltransferase
MSEQLSADAASASGTRKNGAVFSTYVLDAENPIEQARLYDQDVLLTDEMGGPLVEQSEANLERIYDVLDLACGPGGWGLLVARTYPEMTVTGLDLSPSMIRYAQRSARLQKLSNAHFQVMDVSGELPLPDASFDLVNARLLSSFLLPWQWPTLLAQCRRLLRPGGIVRLTEGEWGFVTTAAPAVARLFSLGLSALHRAGRSFSPDGRVHAITPMLLRFVREAGFEHVQCRAHAIDHAYGSRAYASMVADYRLLFQLSQPFLLSQGQVSQQELDDLSAQALTEMASEQFGALLYLLTVWGQREGA